MAKKQRGRIENWRFHITGVDGRSFVVVGNLIDHPDYTPGFVGYTSMVVAYNEKKQTIETLNSHYVLVEKPKRPGE